jgi:dTDP-4-dehydrorhamnose reductase
MLGPKARLHEVWLRYGRPLAVTEVHHGCSREEQIRWFMEVWNARRS